MPAPDKVRILIADEDTLRREGVAALLSTNQEFDIVGRSADGEAALVDVCLARPDIALIDLNLPKVSGIELVRRIGVEFPETKVILMGGVADDAIVDQVVSAGGDGYLLRNGPTRHLTDAISYVRDGGQYFSPQLGRNVRSRQVVEVPVRVPQVARTSVHALRRPTGHFRERLRADAFTPNMDDRDFEIMMTMADGIRPILDRLDEIENLITQMESGETPVPENPGMWLTSQLAESLRDSTGHKESRIPQLIEEAVSARFHLMAGKIQQDIQEAHIRTLEAFVRNIQARLVRRVSALEQQEFSQHAIEEMTPSPDTELEGIKVPVLSKGIRKKRRKERSSRRIRKAWTVTVGSLALAGLCGWAIASLIDLRTAASAAKDANIATTQNNAVPFKPAEKVVRTDIDIKMEAAEQHAGRKEYVVAEDLYRQVLKKNPSNVEALKGLADVLFRNEKFDESRAVLDRLPSAK